ncbi:ocs element-binding factor 1 [Phtheirospermum japonicum]|uniref:Ocs element-binding factor 1 n=1 Tax=Phtheirospermum japonicum TaxID=374723 RepID=A0A830BQM4_9LAMI|nr:ocs element-binding factor 1 [Phtheirospermum japonicum]
MQSNRESARRSRMKKQKHLDDLTAQIAQLTKENNHILSTVDLTKQHFMTVEAENSILRAQMMELTQRLKSLNEIVDYINSSAATEVAAATGAAAGGCMFEAQDFQHQGFCDGFLNNPWPIMASADMFDYS